MKMDRRVVSAAVIAIGVVVAALPGRAMHQTREQNPNAERCAQIMKMLVGEGGAGEGLGQMRRDGRTWVYEGGQIAKAQAELRTAEDAARRSPNQSALQKTFNDKKDEVNRIAGLINRFTDQLSELSCPGAPPKVTDLTGGGGGGVEATPTPTPTATPTVGAGGDGKDGKAAPIDPNDWKGDWDTDYGTLKLVFNADPMGTRDLVAGKNQWGPASNCPEGALIFGGEITWKANTSWGMQEFEAPVVACAVAGVLEGKFNNATRLTAAQLGQGQTRVGYFKFTMSVVDGKRAFSGNVSRWNHIAQAPLNGFSTFYSGRR
jgi:hypothetical protein